MCFDFHCNFCLKDFSFYGEFTDILLKMYTGLHVKYTGLHVKYTGLHVKYTGLHVKYNGLHVKYTGLHVKYTGLHVMYTGLHVKYTGLHVKYTGLHVKYRYSIQILMKLEFSRRSFEKYSNTKFHKNPPFRPAFFHGDGRIDRHDEH